MKREANAVWQGGLKDGTGQLTTPSGVLSGTPYSFGDRFESGTGTNPEELIAAAHAGCFSMALSGQLGQAGLTPQSIRTAATLTFEKTDVGWTVTRIHLHVEGEVPGADPAAFQRAVDDAAKGCPVSRLLKAPITADAKLLG